MTRRVMQVNRFAGTGGEDYVLRHPWPEDCFVQGGHRGVVLGNPSYQTAYFEAFPGDTFIRGEGPNLEDAEDECWSKHLRQSQCLGHEFEARGYTNGAGFCKHCNRFQPRAFTEIDPGLN